MDNERYLHFIASFLIVLILTIPFYTTSVYATINKITVKGGDGILGYAKVNDFLDFSVLASIFNDTVTNDRVVLGSGIKFGTCVTPTSNNSECILRYPGNRTQPFEAETISFTVNLFRSDKTLDDSK